MVKAILMTLLLGFSGVSGSSAAALGPKDGGSLAATDLERVKVGQPAPDFTLKDANGNNISLSDYRARKSVVLVFYRGHW